MKRLLIIAILFLAACSPAAPLEATPTSQAETSRVPSGTPGIEAAPPTNTPADESAACSGATTPPQGEGPFYTPNTPERSNLVESDTVGTPLLVTGKVLDVNCQPLAGYKLDFWQTDGRGEYDNQGYDLRGHQFTAQDGSYRLETVLPGQYPGRTPHIHVKLFDAQGQEVLTSQIYFAGISDQIPDSIFSPELLAVNLEPEADGRLHVGFDFILP